MIRGFSTKYRCKQCGSEYDDVHFLSDTFGLRCWIDGYDSTTRNVPDLVYCPLCKRFYFLNQLEVIEPHHEFEIHDLNFNLFDSMGDGSEEKDVEKTVDIEKLPPHHRMDCVYKFDDIILALKQFNKEVFPTDEKEMKLLEFFRYNYHSEYGRENDRIAPEMMQVEFRKNMLRLVELLKKHDYQDWNEYRKKRVLELRKLQLAEIYREIGDFDISQKYINDIDTALFDSGNMNIMDSIGEANSRKDKSVFTIDG